VRVHDIITGLPRSGTTLVARIVAAARPNAMLLGEPTDLLELLARRAFARGEFAAVLHGYLEARLAEAQRQGSYLDRRLLNLGVPDNYHGTSARAVDFRSVPMPPGGCNSVICKNNEIFTSLAREITAHPGLRMLRVVRHPAGAISSWRRWQIPAREGRSPEAESWSPELVQRLDASGGLRRAPGDSLRLFAARNCSTRYHPGKRPAALRRPDAVPRRCRRPTNHLPHPPLSQTHQAANTAATFPATHRRFSASPAAPGPRGRGTAGRDLQSSKQARALSLRRRLRGRSSWRRSSTPRRKAGRWRRAQSTASPPGGQADNGEGWPPVACRAGPA